MLNPGLKIAERRSLKGWTQAELAAQAGMAQANLSNIEKGKRDLTVSTLLRVAEALEVKPSELIEEAAPETFSLTRIQVETLAKTVVHPRTKTSAEIRELAGLFREILSPASPRASSKNIQQAWTKLRQRFSSQEIHGICQRVEDARQRTRAQKTN